MTVQNTDWIVPRAQGYDTNRSLREEIISGLENVMFNPYVAGNAEFQPLESDFATKLGMKYAVAVQSATAGLILALRACDVGPGDEVITVGNSDISTTAAISIIGATIVLVDILESDYTIDCSQIASAVTDRTKAILPVDLYGHPADCITLREIADERGIKIIEDAALAIGARYANHHVGFYSDLTIISLAAAKPLSSSGNAGMVVTDDSALAEKVSLFRGYGKEFDPGRNPPLSDDHVVEGFNLPMDPLQAVVVHAKLPYLMDWTDKRKRIAGLYRSVLINKEVKLPTFSENADPSFSSYVILSSRRDELHKEMRKRRIETGTHYAPPMHKQPVYRDNAIAGESLPVTEKVARELIALPVQPEMDDAQIDYVLTSIEELF